MIYLIKDGKVFEYFPYVNCELEFHGKIYKCRWYNVRLQLFNNVSSSDCELRFSPVAPWRLIISGCDFPDNEIVVSVNGVSITFKRVGTDDKGNVIFNALKKGGRKDAYLHQRDYDIRSWFKVER